METTLAKKVEGAVLSQLGAGLERLHADLHEAGAQVVDIRTLQGAVEDFWRKFAADREEGARQIAETSKGASVEDDVLVDLGSTRDTSPSPLARSLAAYAVRKVVEGWLEALGHVEESEDRKLLGWARQRSGVHEVSFDLDRLAFVRALPLSSVTVRALGLARQVLDADAETLQRIASNIADTRDGAAAFVRDLAAARRASDRMDQLLKDMWEAAGPDVIEEVLAHREIKDGPHEGVVTYYAGLLKELLALAEKDRQRVLATFEAK